MSTIVRGWPPNIAEIRAKLPTPFTALYAYADQIYNPSGSPIPPHLLEHERTHFRQQAEHGGPDAWGRRYLDDPQFRLDQELEAYRVQWHAAQQLPRAERRELLAWICKSLTGGLYGRLLTRERARALVTA